MKFTAHTKQQVLTKMAAVGKSRCGDNALMAARCGEGGNNVNDKYANCNNRLII